VFRENEAASNLNGKKKPGAGPGLTRTTNSRALAVIHVPLVRWFQRAESAALGATISSARA